MYSEISFIKKFQIKTTKIYPHITHILIKNIDGHILFFPYFLLAWPKLRSMRHFSSLCVFVCVKMEGMGKREWKKWRNVM